MRLQLTIKILMAFALSAFFVFSSSANASTPTYGAWNPHEASGGDCQAHLTAIGSQWSFLDVLTTYDTAGKVAKCRAVCTVSLAFCTTNYYPDNPSAIASGYAPTHYQPATCPAGETFSNGICALPCTSGEVTASGVYSFDYVTTQPGADQCQNSCTTHLIGNVVGTGIRNGIAVDYVQGEWQKTGAICNSANTQPSSVGASGSGVPNDTCPAGQVMVQNSAGFTCAAPAATATATGTTSNPATAGAPNVSTTTGTATTTTNPDGTQTTVSTSTTTSPAFPTDLAKQGEAGAAAGTINSKLEELLGGTATTPPVFNTVSTAASVSQSAIDLLPSVDSMESDEATIPWWSWTPPLSASSCTPMNMTYKVWHFTWDFCPKIAILQSILGWLLAMFAIWEMQSLIFRKA